MMESNYSETYKKIMTNSKIPLSRVDQNNIILLYKDIVKKYPNNYANIISAFQSYFFKISLTEDSKSAKK